MNRPMGSIADCGAPLDVGVLARLMPARARCLRAAEQETKASLLAFDAASKAEKVPCAPHPVFIGFAFSGTRESVWKKESLADRADALPLPRILLVSGWFHAVIC